MEIVSQLSAAGAVLVLLSAVLWLLRRHGKAHWSVPALGARSGKRRCLELIESRSLGPGHALHLVRIADRAVVLGVHPAGCTVIDTRPFPDMAGAAEASQ